MLHLPTGGAIKHLRFNDLPGLLRAGDLLVVNDTRVLPARIRFTWAERQAEILLLNPTSDDDTWECLLRPGKRARPGTRLQVRFGLWADVLGRDPGGVCTLRFAPAGRLASLLPDIGEMPLPPYIKETLGDPERYQTVFSSVSVDPEIGSGSAAAPTAGLHFTPETWAALTEAGIGIVALKLRIGIDTFQPLREENLDDHRMHSEAYAIPGPTREAIEATRESGGRVVAVGTTAARALEAAAARREAGEDVTGADRGATDIFIRSPFRWREVDLLLTNFHLPKSSLLVMVSAFAGRVRLLDAYRLAIAEEYRFYSFGDAMLLEPAASPV